MMYRYGGLSLYPKTYIKTLHMVAGACNASTEEMETGGSLRLTSSHF